MVETVFGKTLHQWVAEYPLIEPIVRKEPVAWFNPEAVPAPASLPEMPLGAADVAQAGARLQRFAPYLAQAFPELAESRGIIESELRRIDAFADEAAEHCGAGRPANLLIKLDSHLPIAGSVKARGGVYEVLFHAEQLAVAAGMLTPADDYRVLSQPACRALFGRHAVAVGSTGNLGLSIGIVAARLGFKVAVHMSTDAKPWKKNMLRSHGATVVEHAGDYSQAVEQGRADAGRDPMCHFVDDENSRTLFLGYAVAGERLKSQFIREGIRVDENHPLFVYLPCGVGGAPGGIAFGLKLAFGRHVHCIFAEPTQSPCMLMGVYTGLHDKLSVQAFGIGNRTVADGLAVGRPSGFVGRSMRRMIDGYYTLADEEMIMLLYLMAETEGIQLEPAALAGAPGFARVLGEDHQGYRSRLGLSKEAWANATHLVWATGGSMMPAGEFQDYLAAGKRLLEQ